MKIYDSVLFDFDGVIIDSEPVHFRCWREVLKPLGIELNWPIYEEHCIGVADYEMLRFLADQADPPADPDDLWAEYGRKNKLFVKRMVTDPPVPAETRNLLVELELQYGLAIVSSSGRAEIEPILDSSGLKRHFQALIFGDDVNNLKPDPEPYLMAAERLGAKHPLVAEDSEPGLAAGRAAGFDVLRIDQAENTAKLVRERLNGK